MSELDRYSRQILVKQVGLAGQTKLSNSRVLIVGVGGLGCHVATQLAGAGVASISIVDHDVIAYHNLHRQILFREADVGNPKSQIAQRELLAINSTIKITAIQKRVNTANVGELISNVDLVIDAADNFTTSYLLSDACLEKHIPLLSASVNRSFGYVGIFCGNLKNPAPSLRALFPKLPKEQLSCDTVGVTGPSVGMIASLQAQEALKILIDDETQLLGRLLYADLWNYKMHTIDFKNANEPSQPQIIIISAEQIQQDDFVIDVRNTEEINQSPQPFAIHLEIPLVVFDQRISEVPKTRRIVLACQSGQRALIAAQMLLDDEYDAVAAISPA